MRDNRVPMPSGFIRTGSYADGQPTMPVDSLQIPKLLFIAKRFANDHRTKSLDLLDYRMRQIQHAVLL